jgi:putative ABC transport system permease protein
MEGDRPPRAAEALLRVLLGAEAPSSPYVIGDLREEYAALRRARGWPVAALWYWWQAVATPVRIRLERRRTASPIQGLSNRRTTSSGDTMRVELRQAVRFLVRRPGFSGAIALTVALAIAATTVAFAVVDGVLLEPLPFENPDRLVVVWEHNLPRDRVDNVASPANFLAWRERAQSFEALAAAVAYSTNLTGRGEPERIGAVQASASLFRMIGATPLVGRLYGEEDDRPGAEPVVVLSESYWRRRFGADPGVVGGALTLNGSPATVVGVLPDRYDVPIVAEFNGTGTHDVWRPAPFPAEARTASGRYLQVFGWLKPGNTIEDARAEMSALAARLREEFPDRQTGWGVTVRSLDAQIVGDIRTTLLVIFGAVCFVLLIACGNVANLLLTRATARQQEMAVRSALGAGRFRLLRQLLLENALLSLSGGALGLFIAYAAIRSLVAMAPDIPRLEMLGLDASVIGFAFLATVVTAILFGLAPAWYIAGADVGGWLKGRGTGGEQRGGNRLRGALVVAQVALSLVLLVGAGLLLRSFANRLAVGVGFDMERLLTAEVQLPGGDYDVDAQRRFFEELVDRVNANPGVRSASAITFAPLADIGSATSFWPMDRPVPAAGEHPIADVRWVHRGFREVLGIPLIAGRSFDETDRQGAPLHVVINETGALQLWPGEDPIGKRVAMPWGDTLQAEVIGVVGDVLYQGPETELRPMLYWEHRQFRDFQQMTLLVRAQGDPEALVAGIRAAVRELDPNLPLYNVSTMEELYASALDRPRFATVSLGLFAALGLLLAGIGVYGVIAYATQQRAREIGIRIALGADRGSVVRMVLSQGVALIGIALVIGAVGAFSLTSLLQSLVFDVATTDPVTFAAMIALLAAVALLACWLPARRASGIDPVTAIRVE